MDRKEMEVILKNSYKGEEILKYIIQFHLLKIKIQKRL